MFLVVFRVVVIIVRGRRFFVDDGSDFFFFDFVAISLVRVRVIRFDFFFKMFGFCFRFVGVVFFFERKIY